MKHSYKIVALIPARSGSKGVPHKNIRLFNNQPLMAHSIRHALESDYITDVFVSTDSPEYAKIAIEYGARITPLRPSHLAGDLSPDIDTFKHFIFTYPSDEKIPDLIVHLRPTYPNRTKSDVDGAIRQFLEKVDEYDSLRSVVQLDMTPYKMYTLTDEYRLSPLFPIHPTLIEPYNQARQYFPTTYLHNGYIDIVKTEIVLIHGLLSGTRIFPYIMNPSETRDIDTESDWLGAPTPQRGSDGGIRSHGGTYGDEVAHPARK